MATSPDPASIGLPSSPSSSHHRKSHLDGVVQKRPGMLFSSNSDGDELSCYSSYGSVSSKAGNGSGSEEISQKWRVEEEEVGFEDKKDTKEGGERGEEEEGEEGDTSFLMESSVDPLDMSAGLFSSVSLMSPPPPPIDGDEEQTPTTANFPTSMLLTTRKGSASNASSVPRASFSSNRDSFLINNLQKVHHSPSSSTFPTNNHSPTAPNFDHFSFGASSAAAATPPVLDKRRSSYDVSSFFSFGSSDKEKKRSSSVATLNAKQGEHPTLNGFGGPSPFTPSPLVGELRESDRKEEEDGDLVEESLAEAGPSEDGEVDWDFWGAVVSDYEAVARAQPQELSQAIQHGIPAVIRGSMWQLMSSSKDPELEALYSTLLHQTSSHEKSIQKDLARTFPSHKFFQRPNGPPSGSSKHEDTPQDRGRGQDDLFNVVRAYSLYDPVVGYVQGSAFIVAALLLNMPDEEAFCVFVRLMHAYGLRTCFLPEMPGLQLRLFQFDRLIEEFLPLLHIHLVRSGVKSSMFSTQWFLTLFSYRFPLALVYRVFDIIFAEGIEAVFRFALALLIKSEDQLLKLEFEGILKYLSNELFDCYKESPKEDTPTGEDAPEEVWLADVFVKDAFAVQITPFQLDGFSAEWDELCRVQNAHADEVSQLRAANRHLSAQVKQLESSMSLLNTEHCEVVNELVKSKIANEEMETELIKFKLLYAELSHTSDSSKQRSSQSSFWSNLRRGSASDVPPPDGN